MRIVTKLSLLIVCGAVSTGCSQKPDNPEASDPRFAGLDTGAVTETIHNPSIIDSAKVFTSDEEQVTHWQLAAMNTQLCHAGFEQYRTWMQTGKHATKLTLPTPTSPDPEATRLYATYETALFRESLAQGDIEKLRRALTVDGGCGTWVPASPNQYSGPTVADAVRSGTLS